MGLDREHGAIHMKGGLDRVYLCRTLHLTRVGVVGILIKENRQVLIMKPRLRSSCCLYFDSSSMTRPGQSRKATAGSHAEVVAFTSPAGRQWAYE